MPNCYQACPICNSTVEYSDSHPHTVCHVCIHQAVDAEGEPIIFFHSRVIVGRLQGYQRKNKELIPFEGNICYIKGVKCLVTLEKDGRIIFQPHFENLPEERAGNGYPTERTMYRI